HSPKVTVYVCRRRTHSCRMDGSLTKWVSRRCGPCLVVGPPQDNLEAIRSGPRAKHLGTEPIQRRLRSGHGSSDHSCMALRARLRPHALDTVSGGSTAPYDVFCAAWSAAVYLCISAPISRNDGLR